MLYVRDSVISKGGYSDREREIDRRTDTEGQRKTVRLIYKQRERARERESEKDTNRDCYTASIM